MSGKQYNNVEISSEELSGLFEETQTTESVTETPQEVSETEVPVAEGQPQEETSPEATENPEVASEGVVIDGVSYDMNAIQEWMEDSINKSEWQKNNTEKSQQ